MLHIAFRPDGQQVWLPNLTGTASPFMIYAITTLKAAGLSGRTAPAPEPPSFTRGNGETFDFQLTLLPDNRHRLHVILTC